MENIETIQIASDLHLEMFPGDVSDFSAVIEPVADALCLCGDIGWPRLPLYRKLLEFASANFKQTYIIAGNHEYYDKKYSVQRTQSIIRDMCERFHNVTFLENSTAEIMCGGRSITVFGATFWSDTTGRNVSHAMNDYKRITYDQLHEPTHIGSEIVRRTRITPSATSMLHKKSADALRDLLSDTSQPVVVLTHHLPSYACIGEPHRAYEYNCAYASNSDHFIAPPVILWAHGHCHVCSDIVIGGVRVVSNVLGYRHETTNYSRNFVISLPELL